MIPIWAHPFLEVLSVLLTILFVSSILRSKRAAGNTLAWLGAIFVFPYLTIPIYLFLNGRKFANRSGQKNKLYLPSGSFRDFQALTPSQKILAYSGGPPVRSNQLLELLPTGVSAYEKLMELIQNAKRSIYITTFIFGNDEVGNAVVDALTQQAASGLDVRILVDSLGATLIRHPSFNNFTRAGGKIAYFMPLLHIPFKGRSNLRNHRKLMVIDETFGVVGGMNLAKEYLGPQEDPKRWVDLGLQVRGECVNDLQEIFLQDWAFATHQIRATRTTYQTEPGIVENPLRAQVVASGPDVPNDPIYDVLLSAIFDAKTSIQIVTPYFIPDESLTKALELAAKRGVKVQLITPAKSNHRLADLARGSFIRQLEAAGMEICFYPKMIHAKIVLIDQTLAILGSANFDMRSLLLNFELGMMIYSKSILLDIDHWIQQKKKDTHSGIPQLNFLREIAEGLGRVLGPML